MIRRVTSVLIVGGLMVSGASAQAPPPQTTSKPQVPASPATPAAAAPAASETPDTQASARRTILRQKPRASAYRSYYQGRTSSQGESGFSNPGGVGRYAEFYGPNTPTSQVDMHPNPVPRFDNVAGISRADQINAAQVGQMRARNIQDNINAYGRPYGAFGAGFGYGFGLSGGLLYNFPN
ncbi:hypothetical protein P12x_000491 [Tundrisphaera lichenicola]|uniref:hypothetical protein n=1 Tax=Tundrisphaera lichenicola TaxID=2029860 RepID=UPI003EB963FC